MEIQLLKGRFKDSPLAESCGDFKNVFFCARRVENHSYEGRLYLTGSALFFVSSFSTAVSHDRVFELAQVTRIVIPRKVIPTVEFTLEGDNIKECFSNFHNLNKITDALTSLLPGKVTIEEGKQGVYPSLNRLVSVPGRHQRPLNSPPKVELCPYFTRSGYCPRQEFCNRYHGTPGVTTTTTQLKHISPERATNKQLQLQAPDLIRSISSPAYMDEQSNEGEGTGEGQRDNLLGIQEEREGRDTPDPVPKPCSDERLYRLESGVYVPSVPPPSFDSVTQRKNAIGNIFAGDSGDIQTIPSPSPPPPTYADFEYNSEDEYLNEPDSPPVQMPGTLLIYPASHIQRGDINSCDKVILPSVVLAACEQRQISYPMAFCFKSKVSDKLVHAGVLEFSSPLDGAAYLPQWMFEHLNVSNGEEVDFQYVDLPKGTFVQLQPVSSAWLGVPYEKRMAILEFQLRNFQTLTEATKVTIIYELNRYTFKVLQCKPAKGVSIVDSDLTTDVVEPADFNRFHSVEEWQAEHIPLSEPIHCSVSAGTYRHFVLLSQPGNELPIRLHAEVKRISGDPDLFLCQTCSTPSESRYSWCDQNVGDCSIVLSVSDKNYDIKKSVFGGVISLSEDSEFTICFNEDKTTTSTNTAGTGHVLRTATSDNPSESGTGEVGIASVECPAEDTDGCAPPTFPPGHEQCSYCGSVMPQLKLIMHERHCAQSNFKCPECKKCFPKSLEKKHQMIAHRLLQCDCGEELPQLVLHHHQLSQCLKRSVKCQFKWCQLSFPLDQLQNHESACGRKTVFCPVCSMEVSQLELQMHLEVFHQVLVDKLDWSKPINSQILQFKPKEPRFKCHCGVGFEFEDDLQVHQLTECSPEDFVG